ncbi:dihydrolipoyllysine-residue acetyltransferase [Thiopseudomonas denitrificans]|uniref:Acetyltransferase component of pyruvate dehydrogenase complex n=1 Tax=Thiopseudomonas denitrificans TaxID=1501432 RepID=A0A4V3D563_9GAMM|nr:dihydrolipoyllysine-residue acetyltransferase [Thiopseudomonas denitrificans]TDQ38847.1 pyruvate dehydrogenase E2 component (dihydrolipoamide acetyltransferase) [Thiopseudomonas denitrificans]
MTTELIRVPDIGTGEGEVIEILVNVGDTIEAEQSLLTLESDKASMEIPAPKAGIIKNIKVRLGDRLKEGDELLELEVDSAAAEPAAVVEAPAAVAETPAAAAAAASAPAVPADGAVTTRIKDVEVPDIGSAGKARVIELLIKAGDAVSEEQSLLTLESDKASMEIPSPVSGTVVEVLAKLDSEVSEGNLICRIEVTEAAGQASAPAEAAPAPAPAPAPQQEIVGGPASVAPASKPEVACKPGDSGACVHAGPAVRKLAREFGVDLGQISPTGPHQRILKEDVQAFVKQRLNAPAAASSGGMGIEPIPEVDFSRFGKVENVPMTRLQQIGASNLHRAWLNIPHVTQFESADITELEAFRKAQKAAADKAGTKLTVLPFLLKACAHLLKELPEFNSSLAPNGKELIMKQYVHIGFAVDTPDGLLVPVIRDVDQKSLLQLALEAAELADKARNKKLSPEQMQGGCFTISSLGHIGGTGFTPIVNAPEVAILGVSRASMQPVWDGRDFAPRLMLPLSLSYDHRVINGAAAARFTRRLADVLAEIRSLLL